MKTVTIAKRADEWVAQVRIDGRLVIECHAATWVQALKATARMAERIEGDA